MMQFDTGGLVSYPKPRDNVLKSCIEIADLISLIVYGNKMQKYNFLILILY